MFEIRWIVVRNYTLHCVEMEADCKALLPSIPKRAVSLLVKQAGCSDHQSSFSLTLIWLTDLEKRAHGELVSTS